MIILCTPIRPNVFKSNPRARINATSGNHNGLSFATLVKPLDTVKSPNPIPTDQQPPRNISMNGVPIVLMLVCVRVAVNLFPN